MLLRRFTWLWVLPIVFVMLLCGLWGGLYMRHVDDMPRVDVFTVLPELREVMAAESQKLLLLNIWSMECPSCALHYEFISKINDTSRFVVVGINYKNNAKLADQWLHTHKDLYKFSIFDVDGALSFRLGISGLPTVLLVDNNGKILAKHVGVLTTESWQHLIG